MDPAPTDSFRDCLCLVCRQSGHVMEKCPDLIFSLDIEPKRSSPPFNPFPTIEGPIQALCQWCSHWQLDALNKTASHRPIVLEDLDEDHAWRVARKTSQIPLGPIGSLRLLFTCPLCRLIFDASYLTYEETRIDHLGELLVVVTGWTIHRLERDLYWRGCGKGKGQYAKCAYTLVADAPMWEPTPRLVEEAVKAIGMLDVRESQPNDGRPLGALGIKQVNPKTPDYCMIKGWLHQCDDDLHHITCRPFVSEGLQQISIATIICLPGRSARSGLPRVGTQQGVVTQLSCEILGKRLLSVMPTLSQQIEWSPWASRAWTFQEGYLSPRRLSFTNHQVYFECNSLQCCKSLDDSNSPFHLLSDEQRRAALHDVVQGPDKPSIAWPEGVIGRGVLRDPFRPISSAEEARIDDDNFTRYLRLVHSYTAKKMSRDADAFFAILTRLEENYYKGGFVQGFPVDNLPRALLWFHQAPPRRQVDFPTWSRAGWEGEVRNTVTHGAKDPESAAMPPLRIWKAGYDDHPELIYNFNPTSDSNLGYGTDRESEGISADSHDEDSDSSKEMNFGDDPVFRLAKTMLGDTPGALPGISGDELLIGGIVIQLSFTNTPEDDYSDSETDDEVVQSALFDLKGNLNHSE